MLDAGCGTGNYLIALAKAGFHVIGADYAAGMMLSVYYQRPNNPVCRGLLGAGFPMAFLCDASGESRLSSVGKINWADLDNLNPLGSLVDVASYSLVLWGTWRMWRRQVH